MNKIHLVVLLMSAGVGIFTGWIAKENITPHGPAPRFGSTSKAMEKNTAARDKSFSGTKGSEDNKQRLSVAQMNAEASKAWNTDHIYMARMWFGGDQQRINRVNDIIRNDFSQFPYKVDASEAKRRFLGAQNDDEKRLYYHEWTQVRLYEMIRVLEVAKKEGLLARPGAQPLSPQKEPAAASIPAANPASGQPEKSPAKLYQ